MKIDDIRRLPSMPLQSPTFPRGPYRFQDRQYLIIRYRTELAAIRYALPEPLEAVGDNVSIQWLDLPQGEGFGSYSAVSQMIPCRIGEKLCIFVNQMYVDNSPALTAGREVWGYPMKFGKPALTVNSDTLTGTLVYGGLEVARGTMVYKHEAAPATLTDSLSETTQITLKLIPGVDGRLVIAQLVAINFSDLNVKGAWVGRARLELVPNVNAALADLPVRECLGGIHILTDLTLPHGRVVHDYLAPPPSE